MKHNFIIILTIITILFLTLFIPTFSEDARKSDAPKAKTAEELKNIAIKAAKNNPKNCSGSIAEVAKEYGITDLSGKQADNQIDWMSGQVTNGTWKTVDQETAMKMADEGKLVVAGLKSGDSSYYQLDDAIMEELGKAITDNNKINSLKSFRDKSKNKETGKFKKYSKDNLTKELGNLNFTSDEIKKIVDISIHTEEHGHVAIVFPGKDSSTGRMLLAGGALGGTAYSEGDKTINQVWIEAVRDKVKFYTPFSDSGTTAATTTVKVVIKGRLYDAATKKPLTSGKISVTLSSLSKKTGNVSNVKMAGIVDSSGYYKITDVPGGDYDIAVLGEMNNPKYEHAEEKITAKGDTVIRDFYLRLSKEDEEVPDTTAQELDKAKEKIAEVKVNNVTTPTPGPVAVSTPSMPENMVLIKGGPTGDFYMGKYEVTNKEYCEYDPGHKGKWSNPDYPVETVSWNDAVAYCQWLSNKTGKNYRLPTEKEWEYACRAGSSTDFYWGENMNQQTGDSPSMGNYAWYYKNSGNQVHPVGQKQPNAWGLYDMAGNVYEWCSDWYDSSSSCRVLRGGGWYDLGGSCQSGFRGGDTPDDRFNCCGFRVVSTP